MVGDGSGLQKGRNKANSSRTSKAVERLLNSESRADGRTDGPTGATSLAQVNARAAPLPPPTADACV